MHDPIVRARQVAAIAAPLAAQIEADRVLPPLLVDALVEARVFKLLVPAGLGGDEASLVTLIAVLEEIARAEGSTGWVAMIGATSGLMASFLDTDTAREVYGPADALACGVFAPMGRGEATDGGVRVSGRWPFASGCQHASWLMGGCVIDGQVRHVLMRAGELRVHDTWDTSGLRGTGSHDIEADNVFVPHSRVMSLLGPPSHPTAPIHRHPMFGVLAVGVASVALGIGRAALDTASRATTRKLPGSQRSMAHRELVQVEVARAEAELGSARAWLVEAALQVGAEVTQLGAATLQGRAKLRLAAAHAASASARAVDRAHDLGGGSSIYARNPLQRHLRDVHTLTAHVMVGPQALMLAGRVMLGVESDLTML
jgi:alkylation response protein AidB-like acyl-CoA dehydrogenase